MPVGVGYFGTVVSGDMGAAVQVGAAVDNVPVSVGQVVETEIVATPSSPAAMVAVAAWGLIR